MKYEIKILVSGGLSLDSVVSVLKDNAIEVDSIVLVKSNSNSIMSHRSELLESKILKLISHYEEITIGKIKMSIRSFSGDDIDLQITRLLKENKIKVRIYKASNGRLTNAYSLF